MIFESTPPSYSSVNDALIYVAYDAHATNPTTYPNYKYVAEIWVNSVLVFTGRYFPDPITSRGVIDVSSIVREYVTPSLAVGSGILAQEFAEAQWRASVVVKIREEYSGTIGAVVLTDSSRVFFNHVNGRINDFTKLGSYVAKPLTARGTTIDLTFSNSYYFIPYFAETTTSFNVVITGGTSTRTKTITPTAANSLILLNISPGAINTDYAGNFTSATESYTVAVGGITYTINVKCTGLYTNYLMHFMNRWGGFESMLFNKVSRKVYDVERKTWQQPSYRVSGFGVVSIKSGNIMYAQKSQFAGRYKEKLKLQTDWVSDTDYQWLSDIITSPIVYVEDNGTLYPITLSGTNYEFREHIVDGLANVSIDVEFGTTIKTQWQ